MSNFTKHLLSLSLAVLLLSTLFLPAKVAAQDDTGVTMQARAGFDGYCQEGAWIPIRVTLENNGPEIIGEVRANISGAEDSIYSALVTLPTVSRKEITLYIAPEGYLRSFYLQLLSDNKKLLEQQVTIDCVLSTDMHFGILAGNPSAFNLLNSLNPSTGRAVIAQLEAGDIPENSQGLEALDVLLISDFDTGALSQAQVDSISNWVAGGGRLLVTGGVGWQKTAAGIADLLPLKPTGTAEIASLDALARFSPGQAAPFGVALAAIGIPDEDAQLLQSETGSTIAAWKGNGSGMVYYLTVDPAQEPLRSWDGMVDVYQQLLAISSDAPGWALGFGDWYLASQAVQSLPGLAMPSIFLICGFLALYILALGPLNYFILIKLKKRELAWLSIPLLVLFFSGFAIIIGGINRGGRPVLNRLALVNVPPGASQAPVDGLIGIYSPVRSSYDLMLGEGLLAHPIPNYNMQNQPWHSEQQDNDFIIPNIRVDVGEVRSFAVDGTVPAPKFSHTLALAHKNGRFLIEGSVTNESDKTLDDAVFLAPGMTQALGSFSPGETKNISIIISRAERASSKAPDLLTTRSFTGPAPGYVYYYGSDTTITDIVGTTNYYDNPEDYRRYNLVASSLTTMNAGITGRGGGFYLTGWSDESPMEIGQAGKTGRGFETVDTTLYIINLDPSFGNSGNELILPPPMFTWEAFDTSGYGDISPYGTNFDVSTRFSILFSLTKPVNITGVKSMTLHVRSASISSASNLSILLLDINTKSFTKIPVTNWGDIEIEDPEKYVSPSGEVILRIEPAVSGLFGGGQLDRIDFTLVVEPFTE